MQGVGFRVQGVGFRVQGSGCRVYMVQGIVDVLLGLGWKVKGRRVQGSDLLRRLLPPPPTAGVAPQASVASGSVAVILECEESNAATQVRGGRGIR